MGAPVVSQGQTQLVELVMRPLDVKLLHRPWELMKNRMSTKIFKMVFFHVNLSWSKHRCDQRKSLSISARDQCHGQ